MVPLAEALAAGLDYLKRFADEDPAPPDARLSIGALQGAFPDIPMELIWQREQYDESCQYDLLLSDSEGTASLGYSRDRGLPWPLRGVQRWSEDDLLVVNNTRMKVQEAIALLDVLWQEQSFLLRLINACIIREELERDVPAISESEVQGELDELRRQLELFDAAETLAWMRERGLSHEKMEMWAADRVAVGKLRERVTAGAGVDYFNTHRADFDVVTLLAMRRVDMDGSVGDLGRLRMLEDLVGSMESGVWDGDQPPSVEIKTLRRWELPPSVRAAVDPPSVVSIAEPIRLNNEFIRVLGLRPARWDSATAEAVRNAAFERWLAGRRQSAHIEWFWGDRETTSRIKLSE